MKLSEQLQEASTALLSRLTAAMPKDWQPRTALILGSGLSALAECIDSPFSVSYAEIPHCKTSRAPGHFGHMIFGELAGEQVVCMQGRLHGYEGHTPQEIVFPLLLAHTLGARRLIVTNAAGAINEGFAVGDLMLITDHINFTGGCPVTFNEDNDLITSFYDMTHAYTPALQEYVRTTAKTLNVTVREGVYLGLRGPAFETPAEIRAFRVWGADAVGMSTVHEVSMASALGMEVCGISLISNMAAGILDAPLSSNDILEAAAISAQTLIQLIEELLREAQRNA